MLELPGIVSRFTLKMARRARITGGRIKIQCEDDSHFSALWSIEANV